MPLPAEAPLRLHNPPPDKERTANLPPDPLDSSAATTPGRLHAQPPAALIVFAKPPTPGRVKTRLTPVLAPEEAALLYKAFLLDALAQYTALAVDVRLYLAADPDAGGEEEPLAEAPPAAQRFRQTGPSLGARMQAAFRETLAAGYERAVIIGTDHPTLPSAFIQQAFAALEAPSSVALGPSTDGGYYLLGMNAFLPALFADMQYSHDRVFAETLARAAQADARITILPAWYDVDEPADLQRLAAELAEQPDRAPRTHAVLRQLGLAAVDAS